MRTFIAIEISDEMKEALHQIESHLKYSGADVKWVKPENIHLTLKFLGEVNEQKLVEIKALLDSIAGDIKPFEITIKEIGAFPKIEYPRVIWVRLDKGAGGSKELAEKIDSALLKIGFEKESRPFAAHLTIGRVRSPKNKDKLKEKVASFDASQLSAVKPHAISSVVLFHSTLTPQGSIYTKLHEAKLAA